MGFNFSSEMFSGAYAGLILMSCSHNFFFVDPKRLPALRKDGDAADDGSDATSSTRREARGRLMLDVRFSSVLSVRIHRFKSGRCF